MADPVSKSDISSVPAPKAKSAPPKAVNPTAKAGEAKSAPPKAVSPAPKGGEAKPKGPSPKQPVKVRLEALKVNLGRTGIPQESALPVKKAAPKPAPGAKPVPAAKGAPATPGAKTVPAGKTAAPPAKPAPASADQSVLKKAAPRAKSHYFILENLCVGCGLCLDKCPPKVQAIGYKFYGDVQEGGFRCYIDQSACISCSACFSSAECPSGALVEVLPDGEVLDFTFTPPERLDFDLRFLHRFHRESR
ncbi:MAG: 4Fe-4S dicluster domain-containing protein [Chlorobiaceae bacterium]